MVLEDVNSQDCPPVVIYAPCEELTCKFCGKGYPSRGKQDPGYCRECEKKMIEESAYFVNGVLDGQKVGDAYDNT